MLLDYGEMDKIIKPWIEADIEHRYLNDVFQFNPTAENLAEHIFDFFAVRLSAPMAKGAQAYWLASVTVKETDKTEATYSDRGRRYGR
jgi:6-pyruvoyltetrahydropterin/6-carboxytetrahydropterin synthase